MIPLDADRLLAFSAVVRERGFSRAARTLGKTQSAVSQAILLLERELGQPLFVRDARGPKLTEPGRVLLEHAERILGDMTRAREALSSMGELKIGSVLIGATDTLACHFLPPALAAFRARYPGIELRLDNRPSPATAVEVAEGRADLGVVVLPLPAGLVVRGKPIDERVSVESVAAHDDVVICPPGHALALRRKLRIDQLGAVPLLLLDRTTGTRAYLDAAFARVNVRPSVHMEMSSVEVLKRLVELGFGVSVVPKIAVGREVRDGSLVAISLAGARSSRKIGLVIPKNRPSSPAAAAFAKVVRASAEAFSVET